MRYLREDAYCRGPQIPGHEPAAQQEVRSRLVSEQSFIGCSSSLPIACITDWTISAPAPAPAVHGKIVFRETRAWCQKGWGLLA